MSEINAHNEADTHHLDKSIRQLRNEDVLTIIQGGQLIYAYNKSINGRKWPKTIEDEKKNPSITKNDNEVTLREIIEKLNITIGKNVHDLVNKACINHHQAELMRTLRKIWNSDTKNNTPIEFFETFYSMSINEFFSKKENKQKYKTALRNVLLRGFNQYYPLNESNQKRTVGYDFSVPELVKLLGNETTAIKIERMGPKTYCRLEGIFNEHKLELNTYLKWSKGGKKKLVDTNGTHGGTEGCHTITF